ncbi:MAG: sugar phosphate isomerase/epimerase [Thermotogae bacterium]|nr:sugar phosphate isomerase/epimerase [Thermotogota bacterium]
MRYKIGVNLHPSSLTSLTKGLVSMLDLFQEVGFEVVELPVDGLQVIANGMLVEKRVSMIKRILDKYDFEYSVHAPNYLNLMDIPQIDLQREVFSSVIDFASFIGSEMIVYHSGRMDHKEIKVDAEEQAKRVMEIEVEELSKMSEKAVKEDICIGVENACSVLSTFANFEKRLPEQTLFDYGANLINLKEQIERVNKQNVGITLDLGHAYISSKHLRFDFLEQVKLIAGKVIHVHIHDNFGKVEKPLEDHVKLLPFGFHDLHLPPKWGTVPLERVLKYLDVQRYILEIRPVWEAYREAKENLEFLLSQYSVPAESSIKIRYRE